MSEILYSSGSTGPAGKKGATGNTGPAGANGVTLPLTQNDVTASHSQNITYQNTTGKPMWVVVTIFVQFVHGGTASIVALTDSSASPSTNVGTMSWPGAGGQNATLMVSFIVLPGNYYHVTATNTSALRYTKSQWFQYD